MLAQNDASDLHHRSVFNQGSISQAAYRLCLAIATQLPASFHQAESARLVDTGSQASKIKTLIVNMTEELEPDTGAAASKSEMETLSAEVTDIGMTGLFLCLPASASASAYCSFYSCSSTTSSSSSS